MLHHTVALCTILCQCLNHSFISLRYSSIHRHFPPTFKRVLSSWTQYHQHVSACLGTRGPMTLLVVTCEVDGKEEKAAGDIRSLLSVETEGCAVQKLWIRPALPPMLRSSTSADWVRWAHAWKFAVSGKGLGGPQSGRCAVTRKAAVRADCRRETGRQRRSQVPHTAVRPERRDATRWLAQPETPHRSDFSNYVWRTHICTPC